MIQMFEMFMAKYDFMLLGAMYSMDYKRQQLCSLSLSEAGPGQNCVRRSFARNAECGRAGGYHERSVRGCSVCRNRYRQIQVSNWYVALFKTGYIFRIGFLSGLNQNKKMVDLQSLIFLWKF